MAMILRCLFSPAKCNQRVRGAVEGLILSRRMCLLRIMIKQRVAEVFCQGAVA
jgi:hypothetical protein